MPASLLILFKINCVLLLFTAAYYLFLRRFTFYNLNRVYLIFGIVFASAYPFINLTSLFRQHQEKLTNIKYVVEGLQNVQVNQQPLVSFWSIMVSVILVGIAFFLIRLFIQLFSLYKIHIKAKTDYCDNIRIKHLDGQVNPFSFWRNIYINPKLYSSNELKNILNHEQIHVKELHTLDILFAELSTVLYWFNPGVWLMKKAIKENIEFITDAKILKAGIDKKSYQYSLLTVNNLQFKSNLVNSFNFSDIKTRIMMMNKGKSSKNRMVIYAFICPLIIAISLIFTISGTSNANSLAKKAVAFKQLTPIVSESKKFKPYVVEKEIRLTNSSQKPKDLAKKKDLEIKEINFFIKRELESDTGFFSPQILIAKLDKISNALKIKLDSSVYITTRVKIEKSIKTDTSKIRRVMFFDLKNSSELAQGDSSKVKYILNGQVINKDKLDNYNPNQIKSITVKKNSLEGTGVIIVETNN